MLFVTRRDQVLGVSDDPHDRQTGSRCGLTITVIAQAEDLNGTNVVGRRWQIDDEAAREEVVTMLDGSAIRRNEYIGERGCGIPDVGALLEGVQKLPDQAVDRSDLLLVLELAGLIDLELFGVHRGMVRLIVKHQHRKVLDDAPARPIYPSHVRLNPLEEVVQYRPVLLDNEDHGVAADIHRGRLGLRPVEVTVASAGREGVGCQRTVTNSEVSDPHLGTLLGEHTALLGIPPEEAFVQAQLRLAAEAVVYTGEYDDELVAGIYRL